MARSLRLGTARALVAILLAGLLGSVACGGGKTEEKRVLGREGRERWVVTFEGDPPDLGEYRKVLAENKDNPDAVASYVKKMRERQAQAHPELDSSLSALGGVVVDRWWMSNQATIEIPPTAVPTVQHTAGVKEVAPDALLAP